MGPGRAVQIPWTGDHRMEARVRLTSAAELKLQEAEFFYGKMAGSVDPLGEFPFYVSAFLAALRGCLEHNPLFSSDARFKDWYRQVKNAYVSHPELRRLGRLRDVEVRQKGTSIRMRLALPEGVDSHSLSFTVPLGGQKLQMTHQGTPIPFEWVWATKQLAKISFASGAKGRQFESARAYHIPPNIWLYAKNGGDPNPKSDPVRWLLSVFASNRGPKLRILDPRLDLPGWHAGRNLFGTHDNRQLERLPLQQAVRRSNRLGRATQTHQRVIRRTECRLGHPQRLFFGHSESSDTHDRHNLLAE